MDCCVVQTQAIAAGGAGARVLLAGAGAAARVKASRQNDDALHPSGRPHPRGGRCAWRRLRLRLCVRHRSLRRATRRPDRPRPRQRRHPAHHVPPARSAAAACSCSATTTSSSPACSLAIRCAPIPWCRRRLEQLDDDLRDASSWKSRGRPAWLRRGDAIFVHGGFHTDMLDHPPPPHGLDRPHGAVARALYGEPTGRIQPDGYPERSLRWVDRIPAGVTVYCGHDQRSSDGRPYVRRGDRGRPGGVPRHRRRQGRPPVLDRLVTNARLGGGTSRRQRGRMVSSDPPPESTASRCTSFCSCATPSRPGTTTS